MYSICLQSKMAQSHHHYKLSLLLSICNLSLAIQLQSNPPQESSGQEMGPTSQLCEYCEKESLYSLQHILPLMVGRVQFTHTPHTHTHTHAHIHTHMHACVHIGTPILIEKKATEVLTQKADRVVLWIQKLLGEYAAGKDWMSGHCI